MRKTYTYRSKGQVPNKTKDLKERPKRIQKSLTAFYNAMSPHAFYRQFVDYPSFMVFMVIVLRLSPISK